MNDPNVLIITESPFSHQNGYGFALHSLFQKWGASSLFQICPVSGYSNVQPSEGVSSGLAWIEGINSQRTQDRLKSVIGLTAGWNGQYSKRWLRRSLGTWRPDLVYAFTNSAANIKYAYWSSTLYNIPLVVHVTDHVSINMDTKLKQALSEASAVLCATVEHASVLTMSTGRECYNLAPIGCSMPPKPCLGTQRQSNRQELLINYIGTVHSPNYLDTNYWSLADICKAVTSLAKEDVKCRLEIYGSASDSSHAKSLVDDKYVFYGGAPTREEGQRLMQEAGCLLIPLSFNPRALEAMKYCYSSKLPDSLASGTPTLVYAPTEAAISKLCAENDLGFLVTTPSIEAIKSMLRDLACNSTAAFARAFAHANYASCHMSSETLSHRLRDYFFRACIEGVNASKQ